ncbi:MAG: hypothetical protein MUO53_17225 [Maribacter sp.]|nr:hypothetical protein [Maribacter sp.]
MKISKICLLFAIVLFTNTTTVLCQDNGQERPPKEKWSLISMQGTVTDINKATREVTLMDEEGGLVTITASDTVERFDEISVGDVVSFEYWTYIKAEFRQPTPEEVKEPIILVAEGGKAPEGMDPGAVVGAVVRAVVTIEVLNRPNMLATVRGPRGNYVTIPMEDRALIEQLHLGQVVILTYAEALAISLQKITPKP